MEDYPRDLQEFNARFTYLKGKREAASELLPRVHLVISLFKRCLMETHQGEAVRWRVFR
jgi:hypothetical protein